MEEHIQNIIKGLKSDLIGDVAVFTISDRATFIVNFRYPDDPIYEDEFEEIAMKLNYKRTIMYNVLKNNITDYETHINEIMTKIQPCP